MELIVETDQNRFSTSRERKVKEKLIALLRDDGHGHHHNKYADFLKKFDLRIIYDDPSVTAYLDFENGIIGINAGFLQDESYFYQLNVLLRHELAHALLKHQIRMMYKISSKYGPTGETHIKMSNSLHKLDNIIADYEISNTRYTEADKAIVRNMMLNGAVIGGLVTEDDRGSWVNLSVEEMYDKMTDEIETLQNNLLQAPYRINKNDFINRNILDATDQYQDITSVSSLEEPLDKFIASSEFSEILPEIQEIILALYNVFKDTKDITILEQNLQKIAKSSIREPIDIVDEDGVLVTTVYTPEEKYIAIEVIKALAGNNVVEKQYEIWYKKVTELLSDEQFTADDVKMLLNALE